MCVYCATMRSRIYQMSGEWNEKKKSDHDQDDNRKLLGNVLLPGRTLVQIDKWQIRKITKSQNR